MTCGYMSSPQYAWGQAIVRNRERWVLVRQLAANCDGFVEFSRRDAHPSDHPGDNRRQRIEFVCKIGFGEGFPFSAANLANFVAVPLMRRGIVRVEVERLPELSLSSGEIPVVLYFVAAQNGVRMSQGRVQFQRLAGGGVRLGKVLVLITAIIWQHCIGIGQ